MQLPNNDIILYRKEKRSKFLSDKASSLKYNPINPLLNNSYRIIVIDKVAIIKKILSTDKEKLKKIIIQMNRKISSALLRITN